MKLNSLLLEDSQKRYGLIMVVSGDAVDFDLFESTEVFFDEKSFKESIVDKFQYSNLDTDDITFEEMIEREDFQDFLDKVWIVDKLGVFK